VRACVCMLLEKPCPFCDTARIVRLPCVCNLHVDHTQQGNLSEWIRVCMWIPCMRLCCGSRCDASRVCAWNEHVCMWGKWHNSVLWSYDATTDFVIKRSICVTIPKCAPALYETKRSCDSRCCLSRQEISIFLHRFVNRKWRTSSPDCGPVGLHVRCLPDLSSSSRSFFLFEFCSQDIQPRE
jgi:hypothetical protein